MKATNFRCQPHSRWLILSLLLMGMFVAPRMVSAQGVVVNKPRVVAIPISEIKALPGSKVSGCQLLLSSQTSGTTPYLYVISFSPEGLLERTGGYYSYRVKLGFVVPEAGGSIHDDPDVSVRCPIPYQEKRETNVSHEAGPSIYAKAVFDTAVMEIAKVEAIAGAEWKDITTETYVKMYQTTTVTMSDSSVEWLFEPFKDERLSGGTIVVAAIVEVPSSMRDRQVRIQSECNAYSYVLGIRQIRRSVHCSSDDWYGKVGPTGAVEISANAPMPVFSPTAPTSTPGYIVFTCYIDGYDNICRIDADGQNERRLTSSKATDFYASPVSPSGERVIFSSSRQNPDAGRFQIYEMTMTGSDQQAKPYIQGELYAPAVSPDGSRIVFARAIKGATNIWVMNRDGSNARALTVTNDDNEDPVWSPDGTQIAFASDRSGTTAHYVMDADGTNVRLLETGIDNIGGRSDWSPDGQWLVFYAGPRGDRDIYVTAIDGSGDTRKLTDGGDNAGPSFSPDGKRIAFASQRDGDFEIFVMDIDGKNLVQLTRNSRPDYQPRW